MELLEKMKKNGDWQEAFGYASNPTHAGIDDKNQKSFSLDDVSVVYAKNDGQNDDANWICIGRLHDMRFFFLSAGCDYSGWDCQAWGEASVADEIEVLWWMALGDEDRKRLGGECPKP